MFHSSTTLWRKPNNAGFSAGENRLVFSAADKWGAFKEGVKGGAGTVWKGIKWVTLPARIVSWPITKPLTYGIKGIMGVAHKGKIPFYTAKHLAKGIVVETIGKSAIELAKAPIENLRMNLVENARITLNGLFGLPKRLWNTPKNVYESLKKSAGSTRSAIKDVFKNAIGLHPVQALKSAGKALWEPLKAPVLAGMVALSPLTEPMSEIGKNMWESKKQYATQLDKMQQQFRSGIAQTLDSHNLAIADVEREEAEKHHGAKAEEGEEHGAAAEKKGGHGKEEHKKEEHKVAEHKPEKKEEHKVAEHKPEKKEEHKEDHGHGGHGGH
ncbi:hypothetical protein HZA44_04455 [Candidatus Peregrinibacteria bacterium]|nr:hypothetical protein [Candidatus Peregrinibacteria bacterium]